MKWFGFPVEEITAIVEGRQIRVGTVHEWADGCRRDVFDIPTIMFDVGSIQRRPLDAED